MFFSKKQEGGNGGNNVSSTSVAMSPPKNLPDLARDIYEKDTTSTYSQNSNSQSNSYNSQLNPNSNINSSNIKTPVIEPKIQSVPKLDLSSLRQNLSSPQNVSLVNNQNANPVSNNNSFNQENTFSGGNYSPGQIGSPSYLGNISNNNMARNDINSQNFVQNYHNQPYLTNNSANSANSFNSVNSMNSVNSLNSVNSANSFNSRTFNDSALLDDGFFKEFEEHILNNGYDDLVLSDLLSQNLTDKMLFYHTAKSDSSPFYASNSELSHAIKIKLEDLKNLERAWIMNNSKLQLMKKFGSAIEYDLSIMSEELKKLIVEAKKRNYSRIDSNNNLSTHHISNTAPLNPSNDFTINSNASNGENYFNIMKKKDSPNQKSAINDVSSPVVSLPIVSNNSLSNPSSSILTSSSTLSDSPLVNISAQHFSTNLPPNPSINISSVEVKHDVDNSLISIPTPTATPSLSNPLSRYDLNKYIVNDASKYFYCKNGQVYRSLKDAIDGLKSMDDSTFNYHVNGSKNDFSKWISGVFSDYKLSQSLNSLHSRASMVDYLNKTTF